MRDTITVYEVRRHYRVLQEYPFGLKNRAAVNFLVEHIRVKTGTIGQVPHVYAHSSRPHSALIL